MTRWLLALWCGLMLTSAGTSQVPAETPPDAYERLVDTMNNSADHEVMADNFLQAMVAELAAKPGVANLEREQPGVLASLPGAVRPVLSEYSNRLGLVFRSRLVLLLRSEMTADAARQVMEFYASPIGAKLIDAHSKHFLLESSISAILAGDRISTGNVEDDLTAISRNAYAELDEREVEEVEREYALRPALAEFDALFPQISALRTEVEKEPMTPSEQAALRTALEAAFKPWRERAR